jgi:hypothetical protein
VHHVGGAPRSDRDLGKEETALTPYELVKDLIGVVHGGDPGRSTRRLSDVLKARRDKR